MPKNKKNKPVDRIGLEASITRPQNKEFKDKAETLIERYDDHGELNNALSDTYTVALLLKVKRETTYKIKADRHGKLYNPNSVSNIYGLDKKDRLTKEAMFKFRTVTEKSFVNYIKFLQNNNDSNLYIAEREMI